MLRLSIHDFSSWCDTHAPGFFAAHAKHLIEVDHTVYFANEEVQSFAQHMHRPATAIGLPVCLLHKEVRLLPGSISLLSSYLPAVRIDDKSAQMVSYGKDVLGQGVLGDLPDLHTVVALQHREVVGVGRVVGEKVENERCVALLTDVGQHLHRPFKA